MRRSTISATQTSTIHVLKNGKPCAVKRRRLSVRSKGGGL